jgi:GNAT superfamily N-acetyltransferase
VQVRGEDRIGAEQPLHTHSGCDVGRGEQGAQVDDRKLAGFACYSFLWPAAGLTRSLYLKELYVSGTARRAGVGARLMPGLFEIAVTTGCSRVEWTTDQDNAQAQAFYRVLGVAPLTSKVFYRIADHDLRREADAPDSGGRRAARDDINVTSMSS